MLQLGLAGYDGNRMDDLDFDKCPPQSVSDSLWRAALTPLSLAVITPPLVHCLVSRALPSGSLRAEHTQSCSAVRYKWALWCYSFGSCWLPRESESSQFVTAKSNELWPF